MNALAALLLGFPAAQEAPTPEQLEFFENKVRPVLVERCYECHSSDAKKIKGGLYLDTREGLLKGGDSGPSVAPGDPDKSLLVKAVRFGDENLQMPPKSKLPADQIAALEAWVKMGAPDPRRKTAAGPVHPVGIPVEQAKALWAFKTPVEPPVPDASANPVDAFVLARLREKGFSPSPEADRRTLLRRVTYDLTGLPPTAEEIESFEKDASPDAYGKVVDRLLASPRYGERWGRHWLDVARYADTKEWVVDEERRLPYPYTYRDWVIQAFNDDLPYDRFITYQLAADRVVKPEEKVHLAALGFITVGRSFLNRQPDIIDDKIDVVTRGLLGLTVQCARCHDHKYDALTMKDYYALYGIFASSKAPQEMPLLGEPEMSPDYAAYKKDLDAREGEIRKFKEKRHGEVVATYRTPAQIADYLLAAQEAKGGTEEQARTIARGKRLNAFMLQRWVASLKKAAESKDPVFAAWTAYAALPPSGFQDQAPFVELDDANPFVRETFAEPPGSLQEAAERYGLLLGAYDRPKPIADRDQEALRQALCAAEAATNMPLDEIDKFFNGGDRDQMRKLRRKVEELHHHPGSPPRAMTVEESGQPTNPRVFVRGNPGTPGEEVPRRFLEVLCSSKPEAYATGGRLELAKAIVDPSNPLTARVWVNRVWHHHFGAGIVRTPSDFGVRGEPPTHPELLDWLAVRFMKEGWSTKKLHRAILLSRTYRQSSRDNPAARLADPENRLLWRMNRRRLDFESMRDSILAAAGRIDLKMGGRSVELSSEPFTRRRTVYGYIDRLNLSNLHRVFDFALPDMHAPARFSTTVPQQALFLMNGGFVLEQAQALAAGAKDVESLYRAVYGRAPTAEEAALGKAFVERAAPPSAPRAPAWQYGLAAWDDEKGAVDFKPLPHFTGTSWQGGAKLPDPSHGWASLTAQGGHAADKPAQALVRRWTAPRDGTVSVSGAVRHEAKSGDGVLARVVSSRSGTLASWAVARMEADSKLSGLEVRAGETLDFVVQCRADNNSDSFAWAPVVQMKDETWSALSQFGPVEKVVPPLSAWEKYAHVLLQSNEFMFVD
jgi:hypothetical protein